jgi:L-fuculose-phosphate aldolase
MLGHGFHPLKAQHRRSIQTDQHVHPEGRTPKTGLFFGAISHPSSEWAMHAAIYRQFPAAQAVVHTHSDACVALACLRRDLPAFHYMVAGFGGEDVRCAPYATFGSPALADHAARALEGRRVCLLANHGMICHGKDLAAAVATALRLETLSRQYLLALQIAPPVLLTSAEMAEVRERYKSYGQQPRARG